MKHRGSMPNAPGEAPNRSPVVHPPLHIKGVTAATYGIRVLGEHRRYLVIQPDGIEPATSSDRH